MGIEWPEGVLVDHGGETLGVAVCLHGFTRSARHLGGLSGDLVSAGVDVIRPNLRSLWWPRSMNRAHVVRELAEALLPSLAALPVVVVGHSGGGAAGCRLAEALRARGADVRGMVLVDAVDSPTHHIEGSWAGIEDLALFAVASPPSPCNREGALTRWLAERRTGRFGVLVAGSGHGDLEDGVPLVYRIVCRDAGSSRDRVREYVVRAVVALLTGGPDALDAVPCLTGDDEELFGAGDDL